MTRTYTQKLPDRPTLADLRAFVDDTKDMPADALIGVKNAFGRAPRTGYGRIKEIAAFEQEEPTL